MGIVIASNFDVNTGLPLDSRTVVADLTARNAIATLQRYEGMIVYVTAEATNFQLVGGITNGDWIELAGSGGGSAAPISWYESGIIPLPGEEFNLPYYAFKSGESQVLPGAWRVPDNHTEGAPLSVRILAYCASASGTLLLQMESTLLSPGASTAGDTTDQYTSTNTADATLGANRIFEVVMDITDVNGEINGIPVVGGDFLQLALSRGTDTAADDIKVWHFTAEVF